MKLSNLHRALIVTIALPICLGGCPMDSVTLAEQDTLAGTYWVEPYDDGLYVYRLPEARGDEGAWRVLPITPREYTGPGLYEIYDDGTWERLTCDETLTLDDVLQLDDPAPAPGDPNERPADL